MLLFILGMMAGAAVGICLMCLLQVCGQAERGDEDAQT